jgi:DNA-directed RNA polymerase subunit beta'
MMLPDVVLDDLTARSYDLDTGMGMLGDDDMIGGLSVEEKPEATTMDDRAEEEEDDFSAMAEELAMLDLDDDLLIDDQTEAP